MKCDKCGSEIPDNSLFCLNCGSKTSRDDAEIIKPEEVIVNNQVNDEKIEVEYSIDQNVPVTSLVPIENKFKKFLTRKFVIICSASLLFIILGIVVGTYAYNNYSYGINIAEAQKSYTNDKYIVAKSYYKNALTYKNNNTIKSKIKLCDDMESSLLTYQKGISSYNNKDYLNAYKSFILVKPSDVKRYSLALNREKASLQNYSDETIQAAKSFATKNDFSDAITQLNTLTETDLPKSTVDTVDNLVLQYSAKEQQAEQAAAQKAAQQAAQAAAKLKQDEINKVRSIIYVKSVSTGEPNSANGVDLYIVWTNKSSKAIKYIYFNCIPYNAVGDAQTSEIGDSSNFIGQVTGSIASGATYGYGYSCV